MGFLYQTERYLLPGFIILDGFLVFNIQRLWRFGSQHTLPHNQVIETNSMSQARRVQQQQQQILAVLERIIHFLVHAHEKRDNKSYRHFIYT